MLPGNLRAVDLVRIFWDIYMSVLKSIPVGFSELWLTTENHPEKSFPVKTQTFYLYISKLKRAMKKDNQWLYRQNILTVQGFGCCCSPVTFDTSQWRTMLTLGLALDVRSWRRRCFILRPQGSIGSQPALTLGGHHTIPYHTIPYRFHWKFLSLALGGHCLS